MMSINEMEYIEYRSETGQIYSFDGKIWNNGNPIPGAGFIAKDWLPVQKELLNAGTISYKQFLEGDPIDMSKPATTGYLFYLVQGKKGERVQKTSRLTLIAEGKMSKPENPETNS